MQEYIPLILCDFRLILPDYITSILNHSIIKNKGKVDTHLHINELTDLFFTPGWGGTQLFSGRVCGPDFPLSVGLAN